MKLKTTKELTVNGKVFEAGAAFGQVDPVKGVMPPKGVTVGQLENAIDNGSVVEVAEAITTKKPADSKKGD